jgi:hypothetical protein
MAWQMSGPKMCSRLYIALAPLVLILTCSISNSVGTAAEAANASEAARPRTLELQLVGPDGKPVLHAEVSFRNTPAPKKEQVKVGEFVKANKYSAPTAAGELIRHQRSDRTAG